MRKEVNVLMLPEGVKDGGRSVGKDSGVRLWSQSNKSNKSFIWMVSQVRPNDWFRERFEAKVSTLNDVG